MSASPIRVLHTITGMRIGGAERLVAAAALGLPHDRFESAVCCLAERGPIADDLARAGVPVWSIGTYPGLRHPLAFRRLVRTIRAFRPQIVHTHLQAANLYGRLAARIAGVPVIVTTEHNVYATKAWRYIVVERMLARSTQALVAVSAEVQRSLAEQLQVNASTIRVIYNGVPPRPASPERLVGLRARMPARGELALGTVASLTPKKGLEHLIRAVARLTERRFITLTIAGDGTERGRLEALVKKLRLSDRVVFLGNIPHVEDLLGAIDVFVLPSLVEGLPLALLEAMSAGVPVVATRVGGVPEVIVSDENGLLVEPGSAEQLAEAVERLAAAPELRRTFAARGQETVACQFTEQHYLSALAALYDELVKSGV